MADVTMQVWRGDEEGGAFTEYVMPAVEGEVVLDVIHRIQAGPAPDLACRWNCKAGKCGSCSAEINGLPKLMCMTRMDVLPEGEPVVVAPMRTFPIIRDLVTDVSFNYTMARQVPPLKPREPEADGTYRMMQIDIERGQEFRKCIECFMCQDVCHVIRDHEENKASFAGPRMFIRFMELESHPLDTDDRRELLRQRMGVGMCNITKCCTEVCPEHIKITDNAIIPLKERVVDASYDPVAWLGRKILRRTKRSAVQAALDAPGQYAPTLQEQLPPAAVSATDPAWSARARSRTRSVIRFLSAAWVDAFNEAVAGVAIEAPGADAGLAVRDGRFTMGQVVTGGPDGDVEATLAVHEGRVTMTAGTSAGAEVTIRLTWEDAVAMAAGELAPGEAIAAGRVRVRGDLSVLAEAQAVLGVVQPHLVALRDRTEY